MPELPEVENARRYLVQAGLPGRRICGVSVGWAKTVQRPSLEDFVLGLMDRTVQSIRRRGKYLLLPLAASGSGSESNSALVIHLGMTGGLRVQPKTQEPHPMVRHTFDLDDGRELRFIDGRKFGKLWLADDLEQVLPRLGPEPLDDGFTPEILAKALSGRNAPVKALLLEQSLVAGLGNLYADESLYLAGVHPLKPGSELSDIEISRLRDGIVAALERAVAQYDRNRQENWPDPPTALGTWTIPRQKDIPCPRCGGAISGIRVRGRGTYFCVNCQS